MDCSAAPAVCCARASGSSIKARGGRRAAQCLSHCQRHSAPIMWRKALSAAVCWLTLSVNFGEAEKNVISSMIVDNDSAESAPRLYRSVPVGVYASRSPYAAYSFQIPAFISAPKTSASRIVPVRQQINAFHQNNGYLRDSYGNRFSDTPQIASYKTAFPQQYVPLQELPAHLAQPLLAASQNKETAPHYFVGSQYRVPSFQEASNNPGSGYSSFPQSYAYSQEIRSLAPSAQQSNGVTTNQQQPGNKLFTNVQAVEQFKELKNEPKLERFEYRPEEAYRSEEKSDPTVQKANIQESDKGENEAAAAITPVTAIVNGKKTVINIETKPPIPLLDLSLLEPITFDNPIVPQLQHFLPRIHDAKYQSLPEFNEAKKPKKAKSASKKKPKQQSSHHHKQAPVTPVVTITGTEDESPELTYEINTPNHKETYKEKTISYNRKVEAEPETFSYNEKTEAKPVHYSYHNSEQKEPVSYNIVYSSNKKPEQLTQVNHPANEEQPRQLIYKFNADEAVEPNNDEESDTPGSAEDSGSSEVNVENEPIRHLNHHNQERRPEAPVNYQHHNDGHNNNHHNTRPQDRHHSGHHNNDNHRNDRHHDDRHHDDRHHDDRRHNDHHHEDRHHDDRHHDDRHRDDRHQNDRHQDDRHHDNRHHDDRNHDDRRHDDLSHNNHHHNNHPHNNRPHNEHDHRNDDRPEHRQKQYYQKAPEGHDSPNKQYRSQEEDHHKTSQEYHPNSNPGHQHREHNQNKKYNQQPNDDSHHRQNKEYKKPSPENHQRSNQEYQRRPYDQGSHEVDQPREHEKPAPISAPIQHSEILTHPQEHEEDIRLLPPQHNAPIRVDPNQHVQEPKPEPESQEEAEPLYNSGAPIIQEQGKRIIIQEESPEELHMHQEQITAEVVDQEDNNEDDFENAYKNAAYGFPAFEKKAENIEKDIYDPKSYGLSRINDEYNSEKSPFQQYVAEGDTFPRSARLNYNKAKEDTEETYLLDYSASKPQSVADRYRNKANYYKLYEQYKPEKYFAANNDNKKEKQRERYTAAPSYNFERNPKPKNNGYFAQYKAEPVKYEYDYSKGTPRDNSAHASNPYKRLKSKTLFVEPQFQYGFDPINLPRLLDSELAAMASNHSPESEKPGMRKKIYEENWYIKKTSTAAGKPS
ncbi:unnamed protein product [Chilo suppressalis]|uniref:Uncharacterized protein n=1 Tax=Chilo suppressalis TaxID=168631 RepID=A0ABN8B7R2_CHISP|nr:unnamed protein product [Chilo suppressalis]